jgi:hypothetical protein
MRASINPLDDEDTVDNGSGASPPLPISNFDFTAR